MIELLIWLIVASLTVALGVLTAFILAWIRLSLFANERAEAEPQMPNEILAWPSEASAPGQTALAGGWSAERRYTHEAVRYVRAAEKSK